MAGTASKRVVVFACFDSFATVLLIWGELFGTVDPLLSIFGRAGHLSVQGSQAGTSSSKRCQNSEADASEGEPGQWYMEVTCAHHLK